MGSQIPIQEESSALSQSEVVDQIPVHTLPLAHGEGARRMGDVPLWEFLLTNVRRHYAHDSSVHAALALLALLNGLALLSSKKAVDVNGLFDALSLGVNAWLMAADFNENKSLPMNHNPI